MAAKIYSFERGKLLRRMRELVQQHETARLLYLEKHFINYYELQKILDIEGEIIELDMLINGVSDDLDSTQES